MGGALIKPGWIITVASQLFIGTRLVRPKEVKVVLGEFDRSKPEFHEQRFEVQKVFIHPKFNRDKVTYDIALLKLKTVEKRTSYVNAICLIGGRKARIFEDREHLSTVTGWGTTTQVDIGEDPGLFSMHLKEATIPLKNMRTCKKATAYDFNPRTMLCAGYIGGSASPCFGDHGAPLVIQDSYSGRWVLIGLYSWSEGCGNGEKFSYYTRVSKFRKWITGMTRNSS
ncbi:transmembrane protease serine 6-like [Rhopilema esculentum]|uniref:transmembrane protease serine 6-like n=1 Tax=Rhopilema esculentum TaxID=499914 RepID=UPI0031E48A90